jgi:transposase
MINEYNVEIADHLKMKDLNEILSEYIYYYRIYQRVLFLRMLRQNFSIKDATNVLNVTERTGRNWLKMYNESGFDGLIPNFGGGRPSLLTNHQLDELKKIIGNKDANYTIKDVRKLIFKKYGIKYSYKQTWVICRKKLKLNYGKPSPESPTRSPTRKEDLKKKLENIDIKSEYIGFLDTTAVQNLPNTVRTLYIPGTKNTIIKNPKKFKLNGTGFYGVNCNSILNFTPNTRSYEFAKIFVNIRLANSKNIKATKLLDEALKNENLSEKYIITILRRKRDSEYKYRETINNKIYDETTDLESTNKHIIYYAKRQNPKNIEKIEEMKKENLFKNLNIDEIKNIFAKEKKLNIILDNYSTHHAGLIENITKILNIKLIFLPKESPDLNPIEDVWIQTKNEIFNGFIEDVENLKIKFEKIYFEEVEKDSYYKNWTIEFLPIMEKS